MPPLISLLRGINVSGHNMIKMAELKALYESLGFKNVTTYIQSGNVVFETDQDRPDKLEASIERAIEKKYGFPVTVIVREPAELRRIISGNPFLASKNVDEIRLYVTFLRSKPPAALLKSIQTVAAKSPDEYAINGREIYLHCPNGYGKTMLSNTFFEKQLKIVATTRNWKTVNTLYAIAVPEKTM